MHIFVKKRHMYASQDYRDNAYGMSGVSQFLKGKRRKDEASKNPDNVEVGCEKGKECAATAGGDGPTRQSGEGSGSTGRNKGAKGEKNEVMTKKQADERAKDFEKKRSKAFVPSTKKTFVGPPRPEYLGK